MSNEINKDVYEKIEYTGERPEYVLKNGKARNCYGLLIDVHELQETITKQAERIKKLTEALQSMIDQFGEPDGSDFLNDADYFAVSYAKKLLQKDGEWWMMSYNVRTVVKMPL